jgi:DNA replication licensing factor MCM4
VIPDTKVAFFWCLQCAHTRQAEVDHGQFDEPVRCPRDMYGAMALVHKRCAFADRQVIRLQETPDAVPDGQMPHTDSISAHDELFDVVKPGDRVRVTGVFPAVPMRVNPRGRAVRNLFKAFIDVHHVALAEPDRLGHDRSTCPGAGDRVPGVGGVGGGGLEEEAGEALAEMQGQRGCRTELEAECVELSKRPDAYEILSRHPSTRSTTSRRASCSTCSAARTRTSQGAAVAVAHGTVGLSTCSSSAAPVRASCRSCGWVRCCVYVCIY